MLRDLRNWKMLGEQTNTKIIIDQQHQRTFCAEFILQIRSVPGEFRNFNANAVLVDRRSYNHVNFSGEQSSASGVNTFQRKFSRGRRWFSEFNIYIVVKTIKK